MQLDEFYELHIVLELEAVRRPRQRPNGEHPPALQAPERTLMVRNEQQLQDSMAVSRLCEVFHCQMMATVGNQAMTRAHQETSEKIRILRRLDFTQA